MAIKMTLFVFFIFLIIIIYKLSKINDKEKIDNDLKEETNTSELINNINKKISLTEKELEEKRKNYSKKIIDVNNNIKTIKKFKKK